MTTDQATIDRFLAAAAAKRRARYGAPDPEAPAKEDSK